MTMSKICRACKSTNITSQEVSSEFTPRFGSPVLFQERIDTCGECGLEGDFEPDPKQNNGARFDIALAESQRQDASRIIEALKHKGIRMSRAERALGLPQRTMFRWKNEGATSAAFALLHIINEFPGLIDVCEAGFSPSAKRQFYSSQNSYIQTPSRET